MSRQVFVVGAASEIGTAIAASFLESGDNAVAVDVTDHSEPGVSIVADCSTPERGAVPVASASRDGTEPIHCLVSVAGRISVVPLHQSVDSHWADFFRANVDTFAVTARLAIPYLAVEGGNVVAVGSVNAVRHVPGLKQGVRHSDKQMRIVSYHGGGFRGMAQLFAPCSWQLSAC